MTQNFTQHSLIRFLYNDVSSSERIAIMEALEEDTTLRKAFQELKSAQQQLPRVKFNAPQSSIKRILGYNKRTALEKC